MFRKEIEELRQSIKDMIYWLTHISNGDVHRITQNDTIIELLTEIRDILHEQRMKDL